MSSIAHLNQNIKTLCTGGHLKETMHILLTAHNLPVHSSTYIHLLQACIEKRALSEGRKVHFHINDTGFTFATHSFLQNKLINMYDKCGSLVEARSVFDNMTEPNVFSWNMIISAYKRHGLLYRAFTLFYQMQRTAIKPDHFTFSAVLPVCTNVATLSHGFQIHGKIIRCGFQFQGTVMNSLIDMYAKSGRIEKARELFDRMPNVNVVSWNAIITGYAQNGVLDEVLRLFEEMPQKNVVSWTAVIAGCAQNGFVEKALEFFKQMQLAGIEADSSTFVSVLPACAKMGALEQGMEIHQKIMERGFLPHVVVMTALIDMYTKCESIEKAHKLFDEMPQRNVVSWTAIITGYAQNGPVHKALELFNEMQLACEKTNSSTFVSILPACAKMGALEQGMNVHAKIIESGLLSNDVVATSLINMYAKCSSISKARRIFDKMHKANVFTWTAMITGYAQNGFLDEALGLFKEMPDRNAVSWNAIISGYAQNGQVEKAMEIFQQMQSTDVNPDKLTFASILPACSKIGALKQA